ncbi:hypothetical protein JFU37_04405 [Pseudomonas sp. TH41]|nr:hypothetical protein [Pseudomonas sp. TH41]MBK5351755.1 hypothetical protein [Pseudomonas sp. TH41]
MQKKADSFSKKGVPDGAPFFVVVQVVRGGSIVMQQTGTVLAKAAAKRTAMEIHLVGVVAVARSKAIRRLAVFAITVMGARPGTGAQQQSTGDERDFDYV